MNNNHNNRKSNTSTLDSIYSEQSASLNSPNLIEKSFNNEELIEDETIPLNHLRTILINPVGYISKDERKKITVSSIGTISSTERLLPALDLRLRENTEGYSENSSPNSSPSTTNISIKSINSPMTPPQRSPLRLKTTAQLPKIITSPSTSSLSPSTSNFPFPSPTGSNNNIPSAGPGYELISLEEARRRVAAARNSPILPSESNIGVEGSTLAPSSNSSTPGLKTKKSGFFRRIVGDDSSSSNQNDLPSTTATRLRERTVSSPVLMNTTFNSISYATTNNNNNINTSSNSINTKLSSPIITSSTSSKSIQFLPTKDTPLPSSPTTIPTSNSFKSKTMSFFSNSTSSSSINSTSTIQPPLPPSLSLRRISETFATGIPSNYLGGDFKIEPPTDTLTPATKILPPPTADLFGRWSIFDSIDDSVMLGLAKIQMRNQNQIGGGNNGGKIPTNVPNPTADQFGFIEFTSTKGIINEKDLDEFKPRSFNNQLRTGGLIEVIDHCTHDCECSMCLVNSNPNGLISRGRFKGSGGRGAIFGSKLVKEAFKLQQ